MGSSTSSARKKAKKRDRGRATEENASPASTAEAAWGGWTSCSSLPPWPKADGNPIWRLRFRTKERDRKTRPGGYRLRCTFACSEGADSSGASRFRCPSGLGGSPGRPRPRPPLPPRPTSCESGAGPAWCLLYEGLGTMSTQMRKDVDMQRGDTNHQHRRQQPRASAGNLPKPQRGMRPARGPKRTIASLGRRLVSKTSQAEVPAVVVVALARGHVIKALHPLLC